MFIDWSRHECPELAETKLLVLYGWRCSPVGARGFVAQAWCQGCRMKALNLVAIIRPQFCDILKSQTFAKTDHHVNHLTAALCMCYYFKCHVRVAYQELHWTCMQWNSDGHVFCSKSYDDNAHVNCASWIITKKWMTSKWCRIYSRPGSCRSSNLS